MAKRLKTWLAEIRVGSALMCAKAEHGAILALITLSGYAPFAERILRSISTVRADIVPRHVLRVREVRRSHKVYDAEVEDAHEFFANGILVHNSIDALRYASSEFIDVYRGRLSDADAGDLGL